MLPTHALTLYQPYAWLVAFGHKDIENRPRAFSHKSFRGDFWIHAGRLRDPAVWDEARKHCDRILGKGFILPMPDELVYGAIIGRATITGAHLPRQRSLWSTEVAPWHFPDQYGLIVKDAVALEVPMPARGYQGFWPVPSDGLGELLRS
jgi:hypothetical protein